VGDGAGVRGRSDRAHGIATDDLGGLCEDDGDGDGSEGGGGYNECSLTADPANGRHTHNFVGSVHFRMCVAVQGFRPLGR
jgi:hypothetical protein